MITLSDVFSPRTKDQITATISAAIDAACIALGLPAVSPDWEPSDLILELIQGVATVIAAGDTMISTYAAGYSVQTAAGNVLRLRAIGYEQISVTSADFARGFVTVLNASGSSQTFYANVDQFQDPTTGRVYTCAANATIINGGSGPVSVLGPVKGTEADAPAGRITRLVTPRSGVSCTNTVGVTGTDDESDASIRYRASLAPIARQPAPTFAKWAFAATDVSAHGVAVTRARIKLQANDVRIILAKATGALSMDELATVSAYVAATVLGDSGGFVCVSATPVAIGTSAVVTLWARERDGRTDAQIIAAAVAAVDKEISSVPIGGFVFGASRKYPGDRITSAIASTNVLDSDGVPADLGIGEEDVVTSSGFTYVVSRVKVQG